MLWHTYVAKTVSDVKNASVTLESSSGIYANIRTALHTSGPNGIQRRTSNVSDTTTTPKKLQSTRDTVKPQSPSQSIEEDMSYPNKIDRLGKILFVMLVAIFNIIFWTIACIEYLRPAEMYLKD